MIGLAIRGLILLAVLAAVSIAAHKVLEHFRQEGRNEIQEKWDKDKAERAAFQAGIILDFQAKEAAADDIAQKRRAILDSEFSTLEARSGRIGRGSGIALPADLARLRDDAARAANESRTGAAPADRGGKEGANAIPDSAPAQIYDEREVAEYEVAGPKAYRDAYDLWAACRAREDVCRAKFNNLIGGTSGN